MVSTYSHNKLLGGINMAKKATEATSEVRTSTLRIGDVTVNITSTFTPQKNLYDIMYAIVNLAIKEESV